MAKGDAPWLARRSKPFRIFYKVIIVPILVLILLPSVIGLALGPIILLSWATVAYGEGKHSAPEQCRERSTADGFKGNPDFYGLGIRLGIYLQWLASLLANAFLPSESRAMAGAYAGFAVALLVAVLLLIFQDGCAYTAEMIILLNILWGGTYLVLMPFLAGERASKKTSDSLRQRTKGLLVVAFPLTMSLIPLTAWFWTRLATVGEGDFAQTPGGTSFLLFFRIHSHHIRRASMFMAFLSIWLASTPVFALISYPLHKVPSLKGISYFFILIAPYGVVGVFFKVFVWTFGFLIGAVGQRISKRRGSEKRFEAWVNKPSTNEILLQWCVPTVVLSLHPQRERANRRTYIIGPWPL